MKANESIEKYPARVREYTNYAIKSVKNVSKTYGPRPVGSENDAKAREYFKADADKFCDEARIEPLKASDKAFMFWVPLGASLMIAAIIAMMIGLYVVTLALTALTLFFIVGEFFIYIPVLDVFFKKKDTANVVGIRKASGETKRKIILSGHTDSAFEWTYTYHGGRPAVMTVIIGAVIGIVLALGASIYSIVKYDAVVNFSFVFSGDDTLLKVLMILMLCTIPVFIAGIFFCNYKNPVVGANDDLTGCFVSMAVIKYLFDNNIRFEHTDVEVLLTAGEEAGLRGSKAYAKAHKADLKSGIEIAYVGFDTVRDFNFMHIYKGDMNGVVKTDKRVVNLIKEGAHIAGYDDIKIDTIDLGSTDAAAMAQAGFPAATFSAMDPTPARYYHTRLDTEENLDPKTIEAGVKIALETTFLFDEKGLG